MGNTSRRDFLRYLAASGTLLPALSSFVGQRALAQTNPGKVKRVIFFYWPNGRVNEYWQPQQRSGPIAHAHTNDLSFSLSPLKSQHHNVVVCKNIRTVGVPAGGPLESSQNFLAAMSSPTLETATIDHILAGHLGSADVVNLGVRTGNYQDYVISKKEHRQRILPINDPAQFANFAFGPLKERDPRREEIINTVLQDINQLKGLEISQVPKDKIDEYESSLEKITEKLTLEINGCGIHRTQVTDPYKDEGTMAGNYEHWQHIPKVVTAQIDNAVAALACGYSNVATLQMSKAGENVALMNMSFDSCWKHIVAANEMIGGSDISHTRWWNDHDNYVASHNSNYSHAGQTRWYVEQFTYLVSQLERFNMLDDTLAVMISHTGDGNEMGQMNGGVIVAGGAATGINPGRVVDCKNVIGTDQLFVDIGATMGFNLIGTNGWQQGGAII